MEVGIAIAEQRSHGVHKMQTRAARTDIGEWPFTDQMQIS